METEESESEEEGGERAERRKVLQIEITRSGDEEETGEDIDGEESIKTGDDREETGDAEETEGQGGEKLTGEQEDVEDRSRDDEGSIGNEGGIGENEEKADRRERTREQVTEEEIVNQEQEEEKDAEIVLLDDITTDEREGPADERATRRHHRRNRRMEEEKVAEEAGDADPQVQETLAAERDISPEAMETRYEAERKQKGKHAAKPQKKKPRQASTTVVIQESTPEEIRVPFAQPSDEDREQGDPQTKEGAFEKMEVLVTKRLLEAMVKFEDPKLQQACDGRAANGKLAK